MPKLPSVTKRLESALVEMQYQERKLALAEARLELLVSENRFLRQTVQSLTDRGSPIRQNQVTVNYSGEAKVDKNMISR